MTGDGLPVLFIHGGPNTGSAWVNVLPHFAGFRCYLVDRPGTELSGDVYDYARRFVPDLLDEPGLDRVHVVASSFGGFVALSRRPPPRVDSIAWSRWHARRSCPA